MYDPPTRRLTNYCGLRVQFLPSLDDKQRHRRQNRGRHPCHKHTNTRTRKQKRRMLTVRNTLETVARNPDESVSGTGCSMVFFVVVVVLQPQPMRQSRKWRPFVNTLQVSAPVAGEMVCERTVIVQSRYSYTHTHLTLCTCTSRAQ